ncbi:MAG TPA: hypothetical protein VJ761_02630 [Ktedonobacteraceae bacterium]|nr:hypothetical protein [Ktedonobacteraceae bacterium]
MVHFFKHAFEDFSTGWDIDSTQVNANADLDSLTPRFAVEARAAMQTHLAALFAEADSQPKPPSAAAEEASAPTPEATATEAVTCPVPIPHPTTLSETAHEELASENAARHDWIVEEGRQQREVHGLYQRTSDFKVSTTDPDATSMRLRGAARTWGITPTMSSMVAKLGSFSRCW